MEKEGIQPLLLRMTIRAKSLRWAEICSGSRKSNSRPDSESRLMNPETINVASIMARMRNNRLLAEANAPRATMTQAMVNSSPRRVTCWRMPRSREEWRRDQMRNTTPRIRGIQEGVAAHPRSQGRTVQALFLDFGNRSGPFLNSSYSQNEVGPAACKPVSVPDKGRWPFIWAKHLCLALATYPRV
jgi:hypothetical protein